MTTKRSATVKYLIHRYKLDPSVTDDEAYDIAIMDRPSGEQALSAIIAAKKAVEDCNCHCDNCTRSVLMALVLISTLETLRSKWIEDLKKIVAEELN